METTTATKGYQPMEYKSEEGRLKIFGFWVFLSAEIVLFSTLFATYFVLVHQTAGGPAGKDLFEVNIFAMETFFLLTSSFTCGLAILYMRKNSMKGYLIWTIITLLLGLGFLILEIKEFSTLVEMGAGPTHSAFLSAFFTLVGTHGLHVSLGIVWVTSVMIQVIKRGFTPVTARKIFMTGLYWHFLDVVWIFLFSTIYLLGVA
ncbi:cytochrome aa3 quinol oxidase subunit III [Shimazuella sp. AN120528]|uniref:cytochrome aa3 quinol oxidase subunit III n=1 Tax=Shimazuella soli TaxID=1892854 RepID=UPI001F0D07D3|nr:cytochrome aa3 quinol oxidase subunit III [Shimazuella soli]MCH5583696.1 cytochrome aa3 quinol oxidase subunit III [Shimazuella soli]